MLHEQAPISDLEKRFISARDNVISLLQEPSDRIRLEQVREIRIASNEDKDGARRTLLINEKGKWWIHKGYPPISSYEFFNPSFDNLLGFYAVLINPEIHMFVGSPPSLNDETKLVEQRMRKYVNENRERLSLGLIDAVENAAQKLVHPKQRDFFGPRG